MRAVAKAGVTTIAVLTAAASLMTTTAQAQDGQVIRTGDETMTCPQIIQQADQAAQVLGGAPAGGLFSNEQAISAATSAAMQGALMSGAGRALPGIGLVSNLAAGAARRDRERREAERLVAQQRWYYLNGLYSGRGCASQPTVAAPPPAQ